MRSPGAVYTLVRAGNIDSTRPSKEMQSGNVRRRIELTSSTQHEAQHDRQQWPESSGQKHHAPEVDRKSPKEMLGPATRLTAL